MLIKITEVSGLVTKTILNKKYSETENRIPNFSGLVKNINSLRSENFIN